MIMLGGVRSSRLIVVAVLLTLAAATEAARPAQEVAVEDLKARASSASIGERPHLCVQIAERQLDVASKLYASADVERAQSTLADVVSYSEQARDYAIQSHKYQKQTEIAVRAMARKLAGIRHAVAHSDQEPLQAAIGRLERVRDDLLAAMFKKGGK
jgi:hypothetical protein